MLRRVYEYVKDDEFRFTVYNDRVHIVNYKKILSLTSDFILIDVFDKKISIKGSNLILNKMLDSEVLIIGFVSKIEVLYE